MCGYFSQNHSYFTNFTDTAHLNENLNISILQPWIKHAPPTELLCYFLIDFLTSAPCLCLFLPSERMGKVAPSVFSGVRTGQETVLGKPADASAPAASVFSKWNTLQPESRQTTHTSESVTLKCVFSLLKLRFYGNQRQKNVVYCYAVHVTII